MLRRLTCTLALLLLASACTATETVTITESARSAAASSGSDAVEPTAAPRSDDATSSSNSDTSTNDGTSARDGTDTDDASTETDTGTSAGDDADAEGVSTTSDVGTCIYLGPDSFEDMQIELRITSQLTEQSDVTFAYTVNDGPRSVLAESSVFVEDLKPGEELRWSVDTLTTAPTDDSNVSCSVDEVESQSFGSEPARPTASDTCRFVELDYADDLQIEITIVSPFPEGTEIAIDYALRGPDGVRFRDGVLYVESAPTGEPSSHDEDTFHGLPTWVTINDFTCEVLSIQGL